MSPLTLRSMLRAAVLALTAALALASAHAFAFQSSDAAPNEGDLDNHRAYVNRDGQIVHAPAHSLSGRVPEGATARCRDGTYSFSRHHTGTCSRHGGVAQWL